MKDIITIIVPCYNVEKYINRCLKSIINQTYGFENIELILINDASTDNTFGILNAYKDKYKDNIRIVDFKKNRRQGAARNVGMDIATGKYLMFVDADDMIDAALLEKMYEKITEYGCDEVRCGMSRFSNDKDIKMHHKGENDRYEDFTDEQSRKNYILSSMSCTVWARLFNREVLEKNRIRFIEDVRYEDAYFSAICCFYINSRYWIDEELYYYYDNPNSIMTSYSEEKNMEHIKVANEIFEELKRRGIYDDVMKKYYHEINAFYFWTIYINPMALMYDNLNNQISKYRDELLDKCPDILENAYVTNITNIDYLKYIEFLK